MQKIRKLYPFIILFLKKCTKSHYKDVCMRIDFTFHINTTISQLAKCYLRSVNIWYFFISILCTEMSVGYIYEMTLRFYFWNDQIELLFLLLFLWKMITTKYIIHKHCNVDISHKGKNIKKRRFAKIHNSNVLSGVSNISSL